MFPKYSVIDRLIEKHKTSNNLSEFYIISVQHLLQSTGSMFKALILYGFIPNQIYLTGKVYSTHSETQKKIKELGINVIESSLNNELGYYVESLENDVKKMWQFLEDNIKPNSKIIILDDGGYTLKNAPKHLTEKHKIYGIEQTTSGIKMQSIFGRFPVIHLASSANKVLIEPKIVSEAVQIQLGEIIKELHPRKIGIVGYGNIGKAIVKEFKEQYKTLVYDIKNEMNNEIFTDVEYCNAMDEILNKVDILIGATGQDISNIDWISIIKKDITLISVSSGDIEFNSILRICKPLLKEPISSSLDILNIKTINNSTIKILRGGMVANFTGLPDSSPGKIIQVTRGLLISAIIQIIENQDLFENLSGAIMLSPKLQKEVTKYWFENQPQRIKDYSPKIIEGFNNIKWIMEKSSGKYLC